MSFKLPYYFRNAFFHCLAPFLKTGRAESLLLEARISPDYSTLLERAFYYSRISKVFETSAQATPVSEFCLSSGRVAPPSTDNKIGSTYYFDTVAVTDFFEREFRFDHAYGDVTHEPSTPAFVKSRPIKLGGNHNGVLLKLDALRHFQFVRDPVRFEDKIPIALFRGPCHQPHRQRFVEMCCELPNTNIGDTRPNAVGSTFYKSPLSRLAHLRYKFIVSVEGNDVATNLKWIMSSNSLVFMTSPRYETWFMEGALVPGRHYVQLRDDYSDLPEKVDYYSRRSEEALAIVDQAQKWTWQFREPRSELLVGLLVVSMYLRWSNQLSDC
jgi:hypothetical protein